LTQSVTQAFRRRAAERDLNVDLKNPMFPSRAASLRRYALADALCPVPVIDGPWASCPGTQDQFGLLHADTNKNETQSPQSSQRFFYSSFSLRSRRWKSYCFLSGLGKVSFTKIRGSKV